MVLCEPNPTSRKETCQKVADEQGYAIIHPFNDFRVIMGQATMGKELLEQVPDLDAILVPVSGGGMSAGIALACKAYNPKCFIIPVEVLGKELAPSLKAGQKLWKEPGLYLNTIAEGIRTQIVGDNPFGVLKELAGKEVISITDEEMSSAMKLVAQRMKLVLEASAGAAVAAALSKQMKEKYPNVKKVGVILCGGNWDVNSFPWIKCDNYNQNQVYVH